MPTTRPQGSPVRSTPTLSPPFRREITRASLAALVSLLLAACARAQVVDGRLDAVYGQSLATQTTQTSFFDATTGNMPPGYSTGSELDAAYGFISEGILHLILTGNVAFCCPTEFSQAQSLVLFIEASPGGQNVLRTDNDSPDTRHTLRALGGLTFDPDFAPTHYFGCTSAWWLADAALSAAAGATATILGRIPYVAPGTLTGGTNPENVTAALVDSNTAGVTQGCGGASGAGVTTGLELGIPLTAIGSPVGCVKVCAFATSELANTVSNQVLGTVPVGSCSLGPPNTVNFANIPGSQYFTVCALTDGVPAPRAPALELSAPRPNPFRGTTAVALTLVHTATVSVDVVDAAGRRIAPVFAGELGPGTHDFSWQGRDADGSPARGGVYFLQARADGRCIARRAIFLGER